MKIKNNIKITLLILLATELTGCPHTVTPEPSPENPTWPQTIEQEDKTVVAALSTATLADSVASMQTILNILDKYKDDSVVKQYVDTLGKVRAALASDDVTSLANAVTGEDVVKLEKSVKQIKEEREITLDDTNKDLFPTEYNDAVTAKNNYDNYKNGRYASAYNTYSTAYGNEENTYLKAYNTYEGAYNTYKNFLDTLPRTEYDKLVNFAKDVVEDFKDNYVFNGNYSEEQVRTLITNAQTEANNQKSDRDAALATYNTAKTEFIPAQETYNGAEENFVNGAKKQIEDLYDAAIEKKTAYDNAAQTVKNFTVGENVENADLTGIKKIQLSIPANAESVDVFAFIETWQAIKDKVGDNSNVELTENYRGKPFNIDLAAKETAGKTNVDVLNSYYNKYVKNKLTSNDVCKIVETELMPGVKIVTLMDRWEDFYNRPDRVQYAISFSRETEVQMPQNYSLDDTYKSGIIGNNVTLKNLNSDTNISGEVRGMDSFSSVYDLFVKNQDVSKLPNMDVSFSCNFLDESDNVYGRNIDTLIAKYYNNNKGSKLTLGSLADYVFDARAYLNGNNMYSGNTYRDNAYSLDINAALVMNPKEIRNVRIVGSKKSDKNSLSCLINVYTSISMKDIIVFCYGVVDFMNEAPARIAGEKSFVTFNSVSNTVVQGGLGYVDATSLTQSDANNIDGVNSYYTIRKLARNNITFPHATINGSFPSIGDFGITKQQVEENANEDKLDPLTVSKVLPRDIKASKMDLMRNILEDNQSTLLSFSGLTRESIA